MNSSLSPAPIPNYSARAQKWIRHLCVVCVFLATAWSAQAAPLYDKSFELISGTPVAQTHNLDNSGGNESTLITDTGGPTSSPVIPPFAVWGNGSDVGYLVNGLNAHSGSNFVLLTGHDLCAGMLTACPMVAGKTYRFSFYAAAWDPTKPIGSFVTSAVALEIRNNNTGLFYVNYSPGGASDVNLSYSPSSNPADYASGANDYATVVSGWTDVSTNTNNPAALNWKLYTIDYTAISNSEQVWISKQGGDVYGLAIDDITCVDLSAVCAITNLTMTGGTNTCNDNGTASNTTDDYFTSDVTVTFSNKPASGNLVLSGAALHSANTVTTIAVGSLGSATSHTFTGVKLKANSTANALVATFSADTACTFAKNTTAVPPCSVPGCPTITVTAPASVANGTVGVAYMSVTFTASSGVSPYSWTVAPALPAGLVLTSAGVLSGTPSAASPATTYLFTATDSTGGLTCTGTKSLSLTVSTAACPTITVTPAPLSSGTVGTAYTGSPSDSGGATPYTWTAASLPAGMSINASTGAITGVPTATGNATITATDANNCTGTTTLVINAFACPIITVTPSALPAGQTGTVYNQTPTASGAPSGSTYIWSASSLPAGLSINTTTGAITGTPTTSGTATITATYSSAGNNCTGTTTLAVTGTACCPQITIAVP